MIARRPFKALDLPGMLAFSAGQYRGYRDAWMLEARKNRDMPDLRSVQVSFAKSAHRAYLNDLARSLKLQAERA